MPIELTRLPKTQFSGLDYDNIIEDIVHLVRDNPDFNENWDDFLSSNAGRMVIELFSYIADMLATRIDWTVNENFIGTATQKSSVMRILKLIGYNFQLPIASDVTTSLALDRPIGSFYLTELYDANVGTLTPYSLTAADLSGTTRTFECLEYDSVNNRYEYKTGVEIESGNVSSPDLDHEKHFYEGVTKIDTFVATTDNNPVFTLTQSPVIHTSVRVYAVESSGGVATETELEKVSSFLDPNAQQSTDSFGDAIELPYIMTVGDNDTVTIEFGSTTLLPDTSRRLRVDDKIRVFYRVGGGKNGNITRNSINTTKRLIVTPIGAVNPEIVNITFSNALEGTEGQDSETAEHATTYAPLQIRTAEKAVTENDYNILINSNVTVIKAKSYGNNNMPANLWDLYGVFIKPLEIWNFVLKDKPGWEELEPSEYNDFRWMTLRLENRFDEVHTLRDGEFDQKISAKDADIIATGTIDWDDTGIPTTFNNYVLLTMPDGFIDSIYTGANPNPDLKLKFCVQAIEENFFAGLSSYNMLYEPETTNDGLIEISPSEVWQLYQALNAYYLPSTNVSGNINMNGITRWKIALTLDNRETLELDLLHGYHEFKETDIVVNSDGAATYNFKATIDGSILSGGADIVLPLSSAETLSSVASKLQVAIVGAGGAVTCEVNSVTGRIRVISNLEGINSSVLIASGAATDLVTFLGGLELPIINLIIDPNVVTPTEIIAGINNHFLKSSYYNSDPAPSTASQELGLTIVNSYDDSGLTDNTTYNYRVNEKHYSITTLGSITGDITTAPPYDDWVLNIDVPGDIEQVEIGMTVIGVGIPADTTVINVDTVNEKFQISQSAVAITNDLNIKLNRTYADIVTLMTDSMSFDITGDLENSDTVVINIDDNFDIDRVKYGMLAVETTTPGISGGTTVLSDINWEDKSFELSVDAIANVTEATITMHEFNVTITAGDIRIESRIIDPKGSVYIEHGTTSDLIDSLGGAGQQVDAPVNSDGPSGYHELGLSIATVDTSGYQECGLIDKVDNTPVTLAGGNYYFKVTVDGGAEVEWRFTAPGGAITYDALVILLNDATDIPGATLDFDVDSGSSWSIVDGDLRCTSDTTGTSSTIVLEVGTTGADFFNAIGVSSFETAYDGEDLYDSGLSLAIPYNFKVNGFTYTLTLVAGTKYDSIVNDLNDNIQCPDFPVNFTASLVGTAPNQDIRITMNTNYHLLLESGVTSDLFTGITNFTALDTPVGGGDYGHIAEVVQVDNEDYIQTKSPSKGEDPSRIVFSEPSSNDVSFWIFGFDPPPSKTCYGYNRFTIIKNPNHDNFGKAIFETGSIKLIETPRNFYVNYLTSDSDSIYIGRYHFDNYSVTDPSWREKGNRVYNTVYDENTNTLDIENSDFIVKFTKDPTEYMSVFAIENDWTLSKAQPAEITSIENPGIANNLDPTNHNIKINIDGIGDVTIDITGDNGVNSQYDLETLVTRINVGLTSNAAYILAGSPYNSYQYSSIHEDGDKIIIKSPTRDNDSSIVIDIPAVNDATEEFLGLKENVVYTYNVTGDYYLEYETFDLTGDLAGGSSWITDLSPADIAQVEVGMIILPISGAMEKAAVTEVDTSNFKFKVSKSSTADANNISIQVSHDLMKLNRITAAASVSSLPDLDFYLHFVWDRRFVEGIYEDYPDGSLDEDIYDASLENNKIVGLNHVFKETKFTTFDVVGTVYYNRIYSATDIKQRVEAALRVQFGLENRDYREPVARSKLMSLIHENDGVDYVEISYLGTDASDDTTNILNTIEATFDEIIILSENIFIGGEQTHGIEFEYNISEY